MTSLQCHTLPCIFLVPKDPFVHKPGEGPSAADLTGEYSDDEKSSSSKQKKKAAEPTTTTKKGTPQEGKVNAHTKTLNVFIE